METTERTARHLLMVAALLCALPGCSRAGNSPPERKVEPKPVQLMTIVEGLSPKHLGGPPILERISCPPRANCLTSRVYRDGTLYYLMDPSDAAPPRWNRIARLSPAGIESLEKLYVSVCGKEDPVLGNDAGSDRHRVNVPGCTQEFVITGIPAGGLAPLQGATDIINKSVIPGSGGPAD